MAARLIYHHLHTRAHTKCIHCTDRSEKALELTKAFSVHMCVCLYIYSEISTPITMTMYPAQRTMGTRDVIAATEKCDEGG